MVKITIELVPGGGGPARVLGVGYIANVGGTLEAGNYDVKLMKSAEYGGDPKSVWKTAKVQDFPRGKLGPWDLAYRALANAVGYRNKGVRT